jgi:hypothetical protein
MAPVRIVDSTYIYSNNKGIVSIDKFSIQAYQKQESRVYEMEIQPDTW